MFYGESRPWTSERQYNCRTRSTLAAVKVNNIDDSLEWFGNYTESGMTPVILMPMRSSCKPYIYVPEGTYAVITKFGKFDSVKMDEGGLIFCLPWTKIQFLVTQQNITFKFPVRACPTYDNIFVALDIAVVFRCKQSKKPDGSMDKEEMEKNVFNFCYRISINQLNEQLEAAITERVRVLIRGKTHLEVYQIKGKTNTSEMMNFLNDMFGSKGLEFIDIIVTEVTLPDEIRTPLDMKAQFGSLNEMEREKYNFDMKIINDEEELELLRQRKYEMRDSIDEEFSKQFTLEQRQLEQVRAEALKTVSEITAGGKAEQAQIKADSELQNQQINGDTLVTKETDEARGKCEAQIVTVDAQNSCNKSIAEKMLEVADLKSETIQVIGQGEAKISNVMESRRRFEYLNKKMDVIKGFNQNKNVKIFGDNQDDVVAQMAAYRLNKNPNGTI